MKKNILSFGAIVEQAIQKSIAALRERRSELASEVIEGDRLIDAREVEIEEACLKLLALHQPVADDLRFVAAVLKTNNELERIADYAVNLAERAAFLAPLPPLPVPVQLDEMTEATLGMLRESLDAFVRRDPAAARKVCVTDDEVDRLNVDLIAKLRRMMEADPQTIERALHLFSASRYLERIADLATNIAEDVVYMVNGEIIRHGG
ncbi:MAG: phosphate signaling complex protein PhoU [Acidobacteriota bacterium]